MRGSSLILLSKVWFIIASYGIYYGLSRILGVDGFGRLGLVVAAVTVINMCFIRGTLQAVSKFVSEEPGQADAVKAGALKMQLWLGGGSFLLFLAGAPAIANLLHSPELTPYLRISSFIILFYSFYAVFIGVLNGSKDFARQAFFDISYSALKMSLMLILAFFLGVRGAITAFAVAAGGVMLGAGLVVGMKRPEVSFPVRKILQFSLPVMALTFILYLTMHLDLFMLKRLTAAAESARYAGWYTPDLTFARLPFMIVVSALTLVIFPFISQATFSADRKKTARYIRQGMRLTYLIMVLGTVLIASSPRATLGLLYPPDYAGGAAALPWISGGYLFFALLMMALTIISGSGRPRHSLALTIVVFIVQFIALTLLIPRYGILGAAGGSALAFLTGAVVSGVYLSRRLGAFMKVSAFLKITLAGLIVAGFSRSLPSAGLGLLAKDIALVFIFAVILIGLKEVGKKDWESLLATLPFKLDKNP